MLLGKYRDSLKVFLLPLSHFFHGPQELVCQMHAMAVLSCFHQLIPFPSASLKNPCSLFTPSCLSPEQIPTPYPVMASHTHLLNKYNALLRQCLSKHSH